MRRNCNANLPRVPKSVRDDDMCNASQQQQVTIFYNGEVCAWDVTEFQARAMVWLASKEVQDGTNTPMANSASVSSHPSCLSMRKSLQMFLQKRKHRIRAAFPNNKHK